MDTLVLLSFAPSDPIAQVSVSARCVTVWFNKNFSYIERNPIAPDDIFFTRNNWSLFLLILAILEYLKHGLQKNQNFLIVPSLFSFLFFEKYAQLIFSWFSVCDFTVWP